MVEMGRTYLKAVQEEYLAISISKNTMYCVLYNLQNFDLYVGHEAEMVAYIADEIPVNTVVLVSTWDEASRHCGSACETAIASLGGDITGLARRGKKIVYNNSTL